MQPEEKNSHSLFTPNNLPEVRREVFSPLRNMPGLRFFTVVTAKLSVLDHLSHCNEQGEDRCAQLLWPAIHLVNGINDTRQAGYGVYYTRKNPLQSAELAWHS